MTSTTPKIFVAPDRLADMDRIRYPEEVIAGFIRGAARLLSDVPYDPATGQLPIRPDVYDWIDLHLARRVIRPVDIPCPRVAMLLDGTVEIRFLCRNKSLTFHVLAMKVVRWTRGFDDDLRAAIEGHLIGDADEDFQAATRMFAWLREGR